MLLWMLTNSFRDSRSKTKVMPRARCGCAQIISFAWLRHIRARWALNGSTPILCRRCRRAGTAIQARKCAKGAQASAHSAKGMISWIQRDHWTDVVLDATPERNMHVLQGWGTRRAASAGGINHDTEDGGQPHRFPCCRIGAAVACTILPGEGSLRGLTCPGC